MHDALLDCEGRVELRERPGKDGKTYVNVDSISPVPSVMRKAGMPEGVNKLELFNLSEPNMEMFETFSDYLKKTIMESPEWKSMMRADAELEAKGIKKPSAGSGVDDMDDDIPF